MYPFPGYLAPGSPGPERPENHADGLCPGPALSVVVTITARRPPGFQTRGRHMFQKFFTRGVFPQTHNPRLTSHMPGGVRSDRWVCRAGQIKTGSA